MSNLTYIKEEIDKFARNIILEYISKDHCKNTECTSCAFFGDDYLEEYICDLVFEMEDE